MCVAEASMPTTNGELADSEWETWRFELTMSHRIVQLRLGYSPTA